MSKHKISYLPPGLKKLKIDSSCVLDEGVSFPKNLEVLHFNESRHVSFFPNTIKKLSINNITFCQSNILYLNLIYLKIIGYVGYDIILRRIPHGLKTLILKSNEYDHKYKSNFSFMGLPESIEYLGLGLAFSELNNNDFEQIIPKNITHFETSVSKYLNYLHKYPHLRKIILKGVDALSKIFILPSNIKSISYNYKKIYSPYNKNLIDFFFPILKTVHTLSINVYEIFMQEFIYKNIIKLKIYKHHTNLLLPKTIQELHIKNIIKSDDMLLKINPNLKKLVIDYDQKHLLDLSVYDTCEVIFKY